MVHVVSIEILCPPTAKTLMLALVKMLAHKYYWVNDNRMPKR